MRRACRLLHRSLLHSSWAAADVPSNIRPQAPGYQFRLLVSTPVETRTAWAPQASGTATGSHGTGSATDSSSSQATASNTLHPVLEDVHQALTAMGLKCGRNCIVGDGLAEVPLALLVQGNQIAIELVPSDGDQGALSAIDVQRARMMDRIRDRVLAAQNWTILRLTEEEWVLAGAGGPQGATEQGAVDGGTRGKAGLTAEHHRAHYLLARLEETLGGPGGQHGCGSCSCH